MSSSIYELTTKIKSSITDLYNNTIGRFIRSLFKKPCRVLFLGIDNAGKTTLLNKLKNNTVDVHLPTRHHVEEVVEIGNLRANVFDIGGHDAVRIAWKTYFHGVDGVVFIVDVVDDDRFGTVADAWKTVLELEKNAPIVVLMNKVDRLGFNLQNDHASVQFKADLEAKTGISQFRNPKQSVKVTYLSVKNDDRFKDNTPMKEAFTWLSKAINEKEAL